MHRRTTIRILLALVVGMAAGCDTGVEPSPAPSGEPRLAEVVDDEGNRYTLVEGPPPSLLDLETSRLIGVEGGTLSLLGHRLTVPAGAVSEPTLFSMVPLANGYVMVDLRALVVLNGWSVDVGEKGFARPVTLSLTYAWATGVADPQRLRILHLREDGLAEPLASEVDPTGITVTAQLEHFSRYCMATF